MPSTTSYRMSIGARVPPASPSRTSVVFLSCMRPCLSKAQLYVVGVDSSAEAREPSTPFALNCASLDFVASASAPAPRPRSIAEMPVEEEEAEDVAFVKYFRSLEHSRALRTRLHETLRKVSPTHLWHCHQLYISLIVAVDH